MYVQACSLASFLFSIVRFCFYSCFLLYFFCSPRVFAVLLVSSSDLFCCCCCCG